MTNSDTEVFAMEQAVMKSVYEKIRTPYKYGSVLKFDVMFYFRFEAGKGAYDTFAVSDDLIHWTKWEGEPLVFCEYEWENVHAHKPWVICVDGTVLPENI